MGVWIEAAELRERFGASKVDDRADRDRDGVPEAAVITAAIADAEGRVRSKLLTRYAPADLPSTPAAASPTLKRITLKLAWYYLWEGADIVPSQVLLMRDDALAELNAVAQGGASLGLTGAPPVDDSRPVLHRGRRATATDREPPITLASMQDWGR